MKTYFTRKVTVFSCLLLLAALSGCGGGGSVAGIDGSGSKPDVSVSAPINGFGSVIVSGVHYQTDDAKVYVKGELVDESYLSVGDFVTLVGRVTGDGIGEASEIHYQPQVSSSIEWIDLNAGTLGLLKQTVQIESDTVFSGDLSPKNIYGLVEGTSIRVSGVEGANRVIRASHVEVIPSGPVEMSGRIDSIDFDASLFSINDLTVDFGSVELTNNLTVGQNVSLTGTRSDDIINASAIDVSMDFSKLSGLESNQMDGVVGQVIDENHFLLNGVTVRLQANTQYENDTAGSIVENQRVRVVGIVSGQTLMADSVEFLSDPALLVYGEIELISADTTDDNILGYLTIEGSNYVINRNTVLQKFGHRYFSFGDFREGDNVYLAAALINGGNVVVRVSVQTQNDDFSEIFLRGPAHGLDVSEGLFYIFNTLVQTDISTQYFCPESENNSCNYDALVEDGYIGVKVKRTPEGFIAESLRLEDYSFDSSAWLKQTNTLEDAEKSDALHDFERSNP